MSDLTTNQSRMLICNLDGTAFLNTPEGIEYHHHSLAHQSAVAYTAFSDAFEAMSKAMADALLPAMNKATHAMKKLARALRGPKPHNRRKQKKLAKKLWSPKSNQSRHILPKVPVKR